MSGAAEFFNPFPGLRAYDMEESHLYFGMERQVDELMRSLRESRFISVIGSSGSGKSSLVKAGLLPSLYTGFMVSAGPNWRLAVMRPGDNPIGNMADALVKPEVLGAQDEFPPDMVRGFLETTLRRNDLGLVEAVKQARLPQGENLLLVVDQFEEIFRFKNNRQIKSSFDHAVSFIKLLLKATQQTEVPIYIVITMRSDYLGDCTQFEGLPETINQGHYLVRRLTREERKSAIVGPVAVGGGKISNRLVMRLLNEAGENPDQLPILQHALMRTWDYWATRRKSDPEMDNLHYEAVGTMEKALSLHADEAYEELRTPELRTTCEKIFKALTEKGTNAGGIRRPTSFSNLIDITQSSESEVRTVLDNFRKPGRSFFMPPLAVKLVPETIIDISHESLMRVWERMRKWVDEEIYAADTYRQISESAQMHLAGNRGLWRNPELTLALKWLKENKPNEAWALRYDPFFNESMKFLADSKKQEEREINEKARKQKQELRRARIIAIVLGSATILSIFFLVYAWQSKRRAEVATFKAEEAQQETLRQQDSVLEKSKRLEAAYLQIDKEQSLTVAATLHMEQERDKAIAQEKEAKRLAEEAKVARILADTLAARAGRSEGKAVQAKEAARLAAEDAIQKEREAVAAKALADKLRQLALARVVAAKSLQIEETGGDSTIADFLAAIAVDLNHRNGGSNFNAEVFSALSGCADPRPSMRDETGKPQMGGIRTVALSPDGSQIVSSGNDGVVRLWDLNDPSKPPVIFPKMKGQSQFNGIRCILYDNQRIIAGYAEGQIAMWNVNQIQDPIVVNEADRHQGPVNSMAFLNGLNIVSVSNDVTIKTWSLGNTSIKLTDQFLGSGFLNTMTVYYPSNRIYLAGNNGNVLIYDFSIGRLQYVGFSKVPDGNILSLDVNTSGTRIAAATAGGKVWVSPLADKAEGFNWISFSGHLSAVNQIAFGKNDSLLASAGDDGSVRLWNAFGDGGESVSLWDHRSWVTCIAFMPDGKKLWSGSNDRTLRSWITSTNTLRALLCENLKGKHFSQTEWDMYIDESVPYFTPCQ